MLQKMEVKTMIKSKKGMGNKCGCSCLACLDNYHCSNNDSYCHRRRKITQ